MPTYAILRLGQFYEWRDFDEVPPHREGTVLPQVVDAIPVFDPATEKVVESTPIVEATQVRKTWQVIPLTANELLLKAIHVDLDQARLVYSALRDGTGTDAARLRRCEVVLAGVLRYIAYNEGYTTQ